MFNSVETPARARKFQRTVWYNENAPVRKGQPFFYDADRGTAAAKDGSRDRYVERGNATNNMSFAGVADADYTAIAGGREIVINEPGSICDCLVGVATVANSNVRLTAGIGNGGVGFIATGYRGRGSIIPMQTTAIPSTSITSGPISALASHAVTLGTTTPTFTLSSGFTNAVVGDLVVVVGDITNTVQGVFRINTKTSNDSVVTAAEGDLFDAATVAEVYAYVIRGSSTIMAKLEDGEESGAVEFVFPQNNGASQHLLTSGGTTIVLGPRTDATGDATSTLANGTYIGQRRMFRLLGALTTNDWQLTVTTGTILLAHATIASTAVIAVAGVEFDAAGDYAEFEWNGTSWQLIAWQGPTLS